MHNARFISCPGVVQSALAVQIDSTSTTDIVFLPSAHALHANTRHLLTTYPNFTPPTPLLVSVPIVPAIDQEPITVHEYADAVPEGTGTVTKEATMGPRAGKTFLVKSDARANRNKSDPDRGAVHVYTGEGKHSGNKGGKEQGSGEGQKEKGDGNKGEKERGSGEGQKEKGDGNKGGKERGSGEEQKEKGGGNKGEKEQGSGVSSGEGQKEKEGGKKGEKKRGSGEGQKGKVDGNIHLATKGEHNFCNISLHPNYVSSC